MSNKFWDITFTPSVRAAQTHYGSRLHYAKSENGAAKNAVLTEQEIEFISERDGFYMATVGEKGQPYIQFRGGKRGFLKILDDKTLGFADFRGNLQYISIGNVSKNKSVALFLMDYANQRRLKILAEAEVKDAGEVPELIEKLRAADYKAKIERAMILHLKAFDWNCPQHITPRFTIEEIKAMNAPLYDYVEKLEAEIKKLKEKSYV
ncbi:MAG: pyridoxamine 5'-phosphate oxidase family protein [Acidobacteriota bacterium]|nr:pyridoxamine 5'-phosphate oxidase family protein [Acidobacteriota bacterium]